MSVTVGSISAALLGVAGHAHRNWSSDFTARAIVVRACVVLLLCRMVLPALPLHILSSCLCVFFPAMFLLKHILMPMLKPSIRFACWR